MSVFVFIGLDLAWSVRNNSAAAVIKYDTSTKDATGELTDWAQQLGSNSEILDFVSNAARSKSSTASSIELQPAILAIDAPLCVPNNTGARFCDKAVSHVFRRFQAGTHPANRTNLGRYGQPEGDIRGETLAAEFERQLFFASNPYLKARASTRQMFECFPHPAMVVLFDLEVTLKYKRTLRRIKNDRFAAYDALQHHLRHLADPSFEPRLIIPEKLLRQDTRLLAGKRLKQYEDFLDAIMCAYVAFYYWWWGEERNFVFGNLTDGSIVTPITPALRENAVQYPKSITPHF